MPGEIGAWVKSIIIIVLLGNLAEFLLPKGDLKRYAGLVVGLILLLNLVNPVWALLEHVRTLSFGASTLATASSDGLAQEIWGEELHQAEAMVLTYPGVRACRVAAGAGPGEVRVAITVSGTVNRAALQAYAQDSVRVTTPGVRRVVVDIRPSAATGAGTGPRPVP